MSRFGIVLMMPQAKDDPTRVDFASREFDTWDEFATFMKNEVEAKVPNWRAVSVSHVEDLPALMEPPPQNDERNLLLEVLSRARIVADADLSTVSVADYEAMVCDLLLAIESYDTSVHGNETPGGDE